MIKWIIKHAKKTPYFHLYHDDGSLYMERYWLSPFADAKEPGCYIAEFRTNPFVWCLQKFGLAMRLHFIATPDIDRHMHDHPWSFLSIVLDGWYIEARPWRIEPCFLPGSGVEPRHFIMRKRGSIAFRRATDRHTIDDIPVGGVWTLCITWPKCQWWGFYTPDGKVHWRDYHGKGRS